MAMRAIMHFDACPLAKLNACSRCLSAEPRPNVSLCDLASFSTLRTEASSNLFDCAGRWAGLRHSCCRSGAHTQPRAATAGGGGGGGLGVWVLGDGGGDAREVRVHARARVCVYVCSCVNACVHVCVCPISHAYVELLTRPWTK